MLGRPSGSGVTLNFENANALDVKVEIGTSPGWLDPVIFATDAPASTVFEDTLGGLASDTEYYYRILYRPASDSLGQDYQIYTADSTEALGLYSFHTARASASEFTFTLTADSHEGGLEGWPDGVPLFDLVLRNAVADDSDFHLYLGDDPHLSERTPADDSYESMRIAARCFRKQIDDLAVTVPSFLVLGNHEEETGWTWADADSASRRACRARLAYFPNPQDDGFYSSDTTTTNEGRRESYYSWTWGDALFVTLDPYYWTTTRPGVSQDAWDWTLGQVQYDWLYETLDASNATWKFVFIHHIVGGDSSSCYGRGGIEWAKHTVGGNASFEWGGEDSVGTDVWSTKRSGWTHGAIHDLLVAGGVDMIAKGHDHQFHYQTLDGIAYVTLPAFRCGGGCYSGGFVGDIYPDSVTTHYNNTGHIRAVVNPDSTVLSYVRGVLSKDEPLIEGADSIYNRDVSWTVTLTP